MQQKPSFPDNLTGNYAQDLDILDRGAAGQGEF